MLYAWLRKKQAGRPPHKKIEKDEPPQRNKGGRPPTYHPAFVIAVREMSAHGWTDFSIARAFNVEEVTIWRWRKQHPDFGAASVSTDQERLEAVRRSLYARATGYSYKSEKIMTVAIGNGMSEVIREPYVEHHPPDVGALKFYLTNKSAGEFSDKQEIESSNEHVVRVVGGLPDDEPKEG